MSRIRPLPNDVVSQIHSSKSITSLQGVVLALVENSLDGGARKIGVSIDFSRGSCDVEDDGEGIAPLEFDLDGGPCKLYHTSKHDRDRGSGETHGSAGIFLASLAALSLLTIASHHIGHDQHATLIMHRGEVISRRLDNSLPSARSIELLHGTCVSVRDLFGNLPVRVKQRALAAETSVEDDKAWQELRGGLTSLLLAWPRPCQIRIKDDHGHRKDILIGVRPSVSKALTRTSLEQLEGNSACTDRSDRLSIMLHSGLVPADTRDSWVPVAASTADLSVRGLICLKPAPSKSCQFISIGIYPCSPSSGFGELYDSINKLVASSDFGMIDRDLDDDDTVKAMRRHSNSRTDTNSRRTLRSRKGVDVWVRFVLQVKHTGSQGNRGFVEGANEGTVKAVVELLEATIEQWLASHRFRPRGKKRGRPSSRPSLGTPMIPSSAEHSSPARQHLAGSGSVNRSTTSVSAPGNAGPNFSGATQSIPPKPVSAPGQMLDPSSLTRIRSGRSGFFDCLRESNAKDSSVSRATPTHKATAAPFVVPTIEAGQLGCLLSKDSTKGDSEVVAASSDDFGSIDETCAALLVDRRLAGRASGRASHVSELHNEAIEDLAGDTTVNWTNPATHQTFRVNTRTGVVLPSRAKCDSISPNLEYGQSPSAREAVTIDTSKSSFCRQLSLTRQRRDHTTSKLTEAWLPGFLRDWNNPVYQAQEEEPIQRASMDCLTSLEGDVRLHWSEEERACLLRDTDNALPQRISKAMLKAATVIHQVDRKFILCKTEPMEYGIGRETLFLVDQHAASERIILERLLADLCKPNEQEPGLAFNEPLTPLIGAIRLERPLRFEVSLAEYEMFGKSAQHFANWAILYELSTASLETEPLSAGSGSQRHTLAVLALPPTISERCIQTPKLIIEVLRSHIWKLADSHQQGRIDPRQVSTNGEHAWLSRIGSCPKGIIDLLNSRACRSAVMFNDELTVEECEQMLQDLSGCASPFICAHGRVSMVPLVSVLHDEAAGCGADAHCTSLGHAEAGIGTSTQFRDDFRRWRQRDSTLAAERSA